MWGWILEEQKLGLAICFPNTEGGHITRDGGMETCKEQGKHEGIIGNRRFRREQVSKGREKDIMKY